MAFSGEFLATFLLVFTVFATAVDSRGPASSAAPFAIGASLWASAKGIGGTHLKPSASTESFHKLE